MPGGKFFPIKLRVQMEGKSEALGSKLTPHLIEFPSC